TEVVVQVAVAAARHASFADAAEVNRRRCRLPQPGRAGREGVQVLGEPDRPGGRVRIVVGRADAVVVRRLVVDDVDLAGVARRRPWEDLRPARGRDQVRAAPRLPVILGERVVDVVVVGVDGIDVAGAVDGDVNELMPIADRWIRVDVDRIVGEGQSAVGGDGHVDAVIVARAGD